MTLNDYQQQAMDTCLPSSNNFSYMMLNLVGELGEFAGKMAKAIRKENAIIGLDPYDRRHTTVQVSDPDLMPELEKEAGDILWQLSGLCTVMGWKLDDVAVMNLAKLADRKKRHVIDGNGDNR